MAIDYGPLAGLIGSWRGEKGMDVSPEPDGEERSPFYETIASQACGRLAGSFQASLWERARRRAPRRASPRSSRLAVPGSGTGTARTW